MSEVTRHSAQRIAFGFMSDDSLTNPEYVLASDHDAALAAARESAVATYILALATDLTTRADGLSPVGDTRSFADTVIADAYRWVARGVSNGSIPRRTS